MTKPSKNKVYSLEGQPARKPDWGVLEVYLGGGRWVEYADESGSFAYATQLSPDAADALMASWAMFSLPVAEAQAMVEEAAAFVPAPKTPEGDDSGLPFRKT